MTGAKTNPLVSFLVLSHAVVHDGTDVFGPAHNVVEHLVGEGLATDLVLHPLSGRGETIHRSFRDGELIDNRRFDVHGRIGELRSNVGLIRRLRPDVVVAIDPLNQFGSWLGSRGRRRPVLVFYTADYAKRRFENAVLNAVYHGLDRFALRSSDVTWSVSQAIADLRSDQGVSAAESLVIPNAPPFDAAAVTPWAARETDSLVFTGMFDANFDWDLLLDGLAAILPRRSGLAVHLVGDGPEAPRLRTELSRRQLTAAVRFDGFLPHDATLAVVGHCRIGLALYSGRAAWDEYRDSLKVREYVSRGVPVITTPTHPLAGELERRGAGTVVRSAEELGAAIERLLDPTHGERAAAAAVELAQAADRTTVIDRALADLRRRVSESSAGRGRPQ
jgi:glycosyltransferase involved in cell wall biosynthesis